MNICIITNKYPGKHNLTDYAFVKQLVDAFARQGHNCQVLVPFNVLHYKTLIPKQEMYKVGNNVVGVYHPNYLSFSNLHLGTFYFSQWTLQRALKRAFRMLKIVPDVIYCHFWNAGYNGFKVTRNQGIPLFVATGESDIRRLFPRPKDEKDFAEFVEGVICVSSKNRDESIRLGLTTFDKCLVLPNAINAKLFYKRDKVECRNKLGFSQEVFIVAFVGWFTERKGVLRVSKAITKVDGVKSVFIGQGEQNPHCDGILFKGAVPHNQIPEYLSAADCFVLPTLQEGCCNAIVEAMSCGLPIISSNLSFNLDILNNQNAILIDPLDVDSLAEAIILLRDNRELREKMSEAALKTAASLTIDKRASEIVGFMKSRIRSYNLITIENDE